MILQYTDQAHKIKFLCYSLVYIVEIFYHWDSFQFWLHIKNLFLDFKKIEYMLISCLEVNQFFNYE